MPRATIKCQVLANFVPKFLPQTVSPNQNHLASAHREEESSARKPVETKLAFKDLEVIIEPPRVAEVTTAGDIIKDPKVDIEPPQVDLSSARKIFVDEVKNILEAVVGVILKSSEGAIF